jgi:nicotinamide riboside transporter PnuC
MWDIIAQIGIAVFGVAAIIMVAKKNKWGFVFGLISQPFWYITSYLNGQWGVFFVSIIYTASWTYGVYNWFYKDGK